MPLMKCDSCHHEWECSKRDVKQPCDWCGSSGHILQAETSLEKLIKQMRGDQPSRD
jgi:hypothetical protein